MPGGLRQRGCDYRRWHVAAPGCSGAAQGGVARLGVPWGGPTPAPGTPQPMSPPSPGRLWLRLAHLPPLRQVLPGRPAALLHGGLRHRRRHLPEGGSSPAPPARGGRSVVSPGWVRTLPSPTVSPTGLVHGLGGAVARLQQVGVAALPGQPGGGGLVRPQHRAQEHLHLPCPLGTPTPGARRPPPTGWRYNPWHPPTPGVPRHPGGGGWCQWGVVASQLCRALTGKRVKKGGVGGSRCVGVSQYNPPRFGGTLVRSRG